MHRFVAARRPATALLQARGVVGTANQNRAAFDLLKMAFEAKIGIAHGQQFRVHAAVRRVTSSATFRQRFVFEDIRTALGRVTLQTIFFLREQPCAAASVCNSFVRWMTNNARHPTFGHGMMARQFKLAAHIHVTGVANRFLRPRRRFTGRWSAQTGGQRASGHETERRFNLTTGIRVDAARTVTGLATNAERVGPEGN